jgi:hypothetical protein
MVDLNHAVRVIDKGPDHAIYKGVAISAGGRGALLYATDFHNGKVDVFDAMFKPAYLPDRPFYDPNLPSGFAPFGIQAINGDLYVSYAKQDEDREDDVRGRGLGYVNVFDPDGKLLRRLVSNGALNAPWGMALAPASFGKLQQPPAGVEFRRRHDQCLRPRHRPLGGPPEGPDHKPIRIRRPVGHRLRQWAVQAADRYPVLHCRSRTTRSMACTGGSTWRPAMATTT